MESREKLIYSRRQILRQTGLAGVGLSTGAVLAASQLQGQNVQRTASQTEGPFYPVKDQLDKDADMTKVENHEERAQGERVLIAGRVVNGITGEPLAGAVVEFWQACATGRYDHPDDPNPAALDPDFQYWAQVQTDSDGHFDIQTIIPGAYPAAEGWIRPPHIHVKVHQVGFPTLTTQLYFADHPLNKSDRIMQSLSKSLQEMVTVQVKGGALAKRWDIFLVPRAGGLINPTGRREVLETPEL
jgi:protocatechuate 3,4-dioxygenase beta subunit